MYLGLKMSAQLKSLLPWLLLSIALFYASKVTAANSIDGIRVWPAPENTRIVFDVKQKPDYKYFTLSSPNRLVIDFSNTKNTVALKKLAENDPRVKRFRTSTSKKTGSTRLVLELAKSYQLTVFPLAPAGQYGNRLVIDLYDKARSTKGTSKPKQSVGDIIIRNEGLIHSLIITSNMIKYWLIY